MGIVGTSKSQDDGPSGPLTITLPAYTVVNAFVSYSLTPKATLTLAANMNPKRRDYRIYRDRARKAA